MSRVGLNPIELPSGVDVAIEDSDVVVKGPKGTLEYHFHEAVNIEKNGDIISVSLKDSHKTEKGIHGLSRSLLNNMIIGVSEGFKKSLELRGAGYRAQPANGGITLFVGFSHSVDIKSPEGINVTVEENVNVHVEGIDKQAVGQQAARIRSIRPPGVYTGKGIRYVGEQVRRKQGKGAGRKE